MSFMNRLKSETDNFDLGGPQTQTQALVLPAEPDTLLILILEGRRVLMAN